MEKLDGLFTRIDAGERLLLTAIRGTGAFRASVLKDAFDGLEPISDLGEVTAVASGITKGRKTREPLTSVPFLRAANLRDGWLDLDEVKSIDVTSAELDRYRLQEGDVLMVEGSGSPDRLGQGWVWEGQVPGCLHQNHVFRARADRGGLDPYFLAWYLQSPSARSYFRRAAKTTSGLTTMNKQQVSGLQVPVPSLGQQHDVVARLDDLLASSARMRDALTRQTNESATLRRAVLHAAMSGDLSSSHGDAATLDLVRAAQAVAHHRTPKKRRAVPAGEYS